MDLSDLDLDKPVVPEGGLELGDLGAEVVSPEELIAIQEAKKYDQPLLAGAAGVARGATLGLSDVAARGLGLDQEVANLQKYNPASSTAGELAGTIGGAFIGPGSLVAKASTLAAEGLGKGLARKAAANILEGAIYGAGQSASDIALRKTDDIAEDIVKNVGMGALTGGLFTVGGEVASKAAKGTKDLVLKGLGSGGVKKASDDAALQFLGATASDIAKLPETRASSMSQMVRDAMTDFGQKSTPKALNTSLDDIVKKVETIRGDAGKVIGDFDNGVSDLLESTALKESGNGNILFNYEQQGLTSLDDALSYLQQQSSALKGNIGFENEAAKIDTLISEIQRKVGEGYNFKDLVGLRRNVDKLLPDKAFQNVNATPEMNAYYDILRDYRSFLQDKVLTSAENIQKTFGPEFKKAGLDLDAYKAANSRFGTASQIIKLSNKGLAKEAARSPLSAIDYMLTGFGVTNPGAIAALGLKKGYEKYSRPALILAGNNAESGAIKKLVSVFNAEDDAIADKVSSFVRGIKSAGIGGTVEATKKINEDFQPKIDEIEKIAANPNLFVDKIASQTAGLQEVDPQVHQAVMDSAARAANFLASKAPKNPFAEEMFPSGKFRPSDAELSSFNRYLKAVEDPNSILDDLKANVLTPEAVEAVRVVYPNTLNKMIEQITNQISESQMQPSFVQKLQLSMLMGTRVSSAQDQVLVQKLQGNAQAATQEEQARATPKGKLGGDFAKSVMPQSERIITRGDNP